MDAGSQVLAESGPVTATPGRFMLERLVLIAAPGDTGGASAVSAAIPGRLIFERLVLMTAPGNAGGASGASAAIPGRLMFERVVLMIAPGDAGGTSAASAAIPGRLMFERLVLIDAPGGPGGCTVGCAIARVPSGVGTQLSSLFVKAGSGSPDVLVTRPLTVAGSPAWLTAIAGLAEQSTANAVSMVRGALGICLDLSRFRSGSTVSVVGAPLFRKSNNLSTTDRGVH